MKMIQSGIFKGDKVIWIVLLLLSLLSLLIVYSSTGALAYRQASGNTLHFLIRQTCFLGVGIGIMLFLVNFVPVKFFAMLSNLLVYFSIGLLMFAVAMRLTGRMDGTGRTLDLGFFHFSRPNLQRFHSSCTLLKYWANTSRARLNSKEPSIWSWGIQL